MKKVSVDSRIEARCHSQPYRCALGRIDHRRLELKELVINLDPMDRIIKVVRGPVLAWQERSPIDGAGHLARGRSVLLEHSLAR
jgi:hypothetical protein